MIDMQWRRKTNQRIGRDGDNHQTRARHMQADVQRAKALMLDRPASMHDHANKLDALRNAVRNHAPLWISAATISGLMLANKTTVLHSVAITLATRLAISSMRAKLKRII